MADAVYQKFVKRWEEVTDIPPQSLGPLTPYYKMAVSRLKVMPWLWLVIGCSLLVIGLYMLTGSSVTFFVTLLQRGF